MELISRMMDGSIPPDPERPGRGWFGFRVNQDARIDRLQSVPLLEGASRRQLKAIARITEIREVPAGTVITRAGQPGDEFFLLLDGKARVEVSPRKRATLRPGDFFGEMSLLDGGPRSATVVAETAVRLLVIARRDFSKLLTEAPDLTRAIMAVLCRRVRQAEQALNA
jgi:CRP/FNR family cyclic AMP-dependent transcriptional regulator